ncbi:MAG TPA: hypothetical protein VHN80_12570, partial [Kineosporiaceae bacterium]|nr:hypothetical protein [Kineosporiaceae bacterium]
MRNGAEPVVRVRRSVTSCSGCLAWGLIYAQGVCAACYNFADPRHRHDGGECASCHRQVRLKKGHCRLCWCQAYLERTSGPNTLLAPHLRTVRHQQLFLAGMEQRRATRPPTVHRKGAIGRPLKPPPSPAARPHSTYLQLALFADILPRVYAYGRIDLRRGPAPGNPWLAWALHLAHTMAETRGWEPHLRQGMQRVLVMLLSEHTDGQMIAASDFHRITTKHATNTDHVAEILTIMGVLNDDRPRTFDVWLAAKTDTVRAAIGRDVRTWATTLHDGGPRVRARNPATATGYLNAALPALVSWSSRYDHLREVTRPDVQAYLDTLHGHAREIALTALRSLFAWARRNKLIFRDPTSRVHVAKTPQALWQPLRPTEIGQAIAAATTPQARLFVAFAAIHAARPGQVRAMLLSDVDLPNRT